MRFFPPKKINIWYGYRTERSMKSQDSWDAANRYAAGLMIFLGFDLALTGAVIYWLFPELDKEIYSLISIALMIIAGVILLFLTEKHLKKNFDEHGDMFKP